MFQGSCVVSRCEYKAFGLSANFMSWAGTVVLNQAHRFRRSKSRREKTLSGGVVELLAVEAVSQSDVLEARRVALHGCLQQLPASDRQIVQQCYC